MLVSVIMPYFKKKKYISESINSVLNQTYQKYEIIIVYDDDNLDELSYLEKLKQNNCQIKIVKNDKNMGAGYSRNIGIKKSSGELIAFLDCDDVWNSNKLEEQIRFMKKNKISFSYTAYYIIDESSKKIGLRSVKNELSYDDLIKSCDIGLSTVMLSKNLISRENNFANLKTKEDYVLWLKLAKSKVTMLGIKEVYSSWRKSDNSLSSNTIQKLKDGFVVYYKYMGFNIIKSLFCLLRLSLNFLIKNK